MYQTDVYDDLNGYLRDHWGEEGELE